MVRGFIDQCEQEPLHLSGAIQSHGAMLILNAQGYVSHVSANFPSVKACQIDELLGLSSINLAIFLGCTALLPQLDALPNQAGARTQMRVEMSGEGRYYDLVLSRSTNSDTVLEWYPVKLPHLEAIASQIVEQLNLPERIQDNAHLQQLRQQLILWLAQITDCERVLYYQFLASGDGQVIAEHYQCSTRGSYLGLHYPASDIPMIARRLYLLNPWRHIADVLQKDIPVMSQTPIAPDLSYVDLRSVSPVHKTYMTNMGDRASLSFPIKLNDQLDALVTCRHHSAKRFDHSQLLAIVERIQHFNGLLVEFQRQEKTRRANQRQQCLQQLEHYVATTKWPDAWFQIAALLCDYFQSQGAIFVDHGKLHLYGLMPEQPQWLAQLSESINQPLDEADNANHQVLSFISDNLQAALSERGYPAQIPDVIAGVAACYWGKDAAYGLYLLRDEYLHDVAWGGNPDKPVQRPDVKQGLAPRESFARWVEQRQGFSQPWPEEIELQLTEVVQCLQKYLPA